MNDDRSEAADADPTAVNSQVTDSVESGEDGSTEGTLGSEPGVPMAPTRLGAVPSSYGEPGGLEDAAENAEGLPPA